jgi:hypothetical protein
MTSISKILLKNGVNGLLDKEDEYFKENICQALALKLNESMQSVLQDASSLMLVTNKQTEHTSELVEFLDFINNFKSGKYEFKNNSVINITESEIESIKNLFEALDVENRQKMVKEIFEDSQKFKNHIDFYNNSKGLLE